ncbi:tetratricopeptide repeat-containing sulfotransferase family protein [Biformimicrobium ophioploci]|uniref:Tetratricopeptide repeat-containing sulfotransferase family protein n=1 Tax=Biformimicrobium ophioploci TaxID=3036711 RepID=A0ABQ6LVM1_9GAMM|nr:tetratricopeptide repeat-containing sulfotransferase family protein [Microbulbifer sp. NKW57]GMG86148.1 tetratricopeptide repeat-containing sulfotransferase family protein [Microbulbifer sp. NKW57]
MNQLHTLDTARASFADAAQALKQKRPKEAERICRALLQEQPGNLPHLQLLAHSLILQERLAEAEALLHRGLKLAPDLPSLHDELGSLYAQSARYDQAIAAFDQAISLDSNNPRTHQKRAKALHLLGRDSEAETAFRKFLEKDPVAGEVAEGVRLWREGKLGDAETALRAVLRKSPENIDAMRYLALVLQDAGKNLLDAEALLRNAIQRAPDFLPALQNLGALLLERQQWEAAAEVFENIVAQDSGDALAWSSLGHARTRSGDIERGLSNYDQAAALNPQSAGVHMSRGHLLKTLGRQQESLAAYRQAIHYNPALGEVYWSMANLKVFRFTDAEVRAMLGQLQLDTLSDSARVHFNFALGKAFEDLQDFDRAWSHYHKGNQLQRGLVDYDPVEHQLMLDDIREQFSPDFVERHRGEGSSREDPIFIVGLPRSGSTLIEQILASHSQVEGTEELPNIATLAQATARYRRDGAAFPKTVENFNSRDFESFARKYLAEVKHLRTLGKPYFIDKMPNNFAYIGWIKLMFPRAKIINTRRYPLDSCLGAYKQLFAKGQNFTYDMLELADYYRGYTGIMAHWHRLFPGEILDVHYEGHMDDFEGQVRKILAYCGLEYEPQCLRFYENQRAVRTASSEQVRQPIYRSALGLWKNYRAHLGMWEEDLSDILDALPTQVKALAG